MAARAFTAMTSTLSFEEFAAASPLRDPVDRKKLLFAYRALEDLAAERRGAVHDLSVLEIACGTGGVTLPLARAGARVRALDTDPRNLDALQAAMARAGLNNVTTTLADASAFRSDERFDVAVASEVIERVPDPDALLANIVHHLKPDGLVIVATVNGWGPRELSSYLNPRNLAHRWNRSRASAPAAPDGAHTRPGAGRHFTAGKLVTLFNRNGLAVHRFMNSDFVFSISKTLRESPAIGSLDAELADLVPHWMASGWYVALRPGGLAGGTIPAPVLRKGVPFPAPQGLHGAP
jgi:2-polyprenyl-3-methyl-5-hydroxy-6-metoxy-1,4-benzoquinol methylase